MQDKERNYYNTFVRVRDFGVENAVDFPVGSAGATNFALVAAATDAMEQSGATQISGAASQMITQKDIANAELRAELRAINRTARALAVDNPGIGDLFRMPHGSSEQDLLVAAMAFVTNATPLAAQFVAFGLPVGFLTGLQADIDAFAAAVTDKSSASGEKVSATASIGYGVKNGLEALRRLRAIVPNKYSGRPAKLAAWASASHVERPPKKKPLPPTP